MDDASSQHPTREIDQACSYFRIGTGPKGRGLYATCDIFPLTCLHVAPCLNVSREEYHSHMRFTILEHYLFNVHDGNKLLALGYGSLFNHSRHPNVNYRVDGHNATITFISGPKIVKKGEELCISYGSNLWFDDADGASISNESDESPSVEEVEDALCSGFLARIDIPGDPDDP